MLSWALYDRHGTLLGPVTRRAVGSSVDVTFNDQQTATLRLSLEDELASEIAPMASVVRAFLDGAIIFAGVVTEPTYDGAAGTLDVPCVDASLGLQRAFVGQRSDGAGLYGSVSGNPYRWEGQLESSMSWWLALHALPSAAETAAGVPDHGVRFGSGPDFGQARDREYEVGKQIWEAMTDLAAVQHGLDLYLEPALNTADPAALAYLRTYTRMGSDRSDTVRLEFAAGDNTASNLRYMPSAAIINRMTGVGAAPAYDGSGDAPVPPRYTADQSESQIAYGLNAAYVGLPDVSEVTTIAEHVAEVVTTAAFPIDFFDVVPALEDGTGFVTDSAGHVRRVPGFGRAPRFGPAGEWWLGDDFRTVGRLGSREVDFHGRVTGATIEEADEAGNVRVTVHSAPRVIGVVVS